MHPLTRFIVCHHIEARPLSYSSPPVLQMLLCDLLLFSSLTRCITDIHIRICNAQVDVVDKDGLTVPTASSNVTFRVTGGATIIGTGNGDPACHTPDKSPTRPAFHGLVLGVVQSTRAADPSAANAVLATVEVSAPGLKGDTISINGNAIGRQDPLL
jgi:hypothetical protein